MIHLSQPLNIDDHETLSPAVRARATSDLRLIDDLWPTHYKVLHRVITVAEHHMDRGMLVFYLRERLSRMASMAVEAPFSQSLDELDDQAVRAQILRVGHPVVEAVVAAGIISALTLIVDAEALKQQHAPLREAIIEEQRRLHEEWYDAKQRGRHGLANILKEKIDLLEDKKIIAPTYDARRHAELAQLAQLVRHPTEGERHRAAVMYCPRGGTRALVPELATLSTEEATQITSRTRDNAVHRAASELRKKLSAVNSIHPTTPPRTAWAFWDVAV